MPNLKYALVAALVLAHTTAVWAQAPRAIHWQTDLDAARAMAEREQKLLLVHFYTDSCGPCRMLDSTVFNQPTVAAAVHPHYVPVKLNANDFQATAERFGITRVPTDIVITPKGQVLERMVSPATPMAYISHMTGIADQHRLQRKRSFPTANANSGTSEAVNPAYAGLTVPGDANSFTTPAKPNNAGMTTNPYTNSTGTVTPRYGAATTPNAPVADPPAAPVAVANPYSGAGTPVGAKAQSPPSATDRYPTAAVAPVATAAQPAPAATPQLPPDSPPLGFFGYCAVTMKKENRWQRGDARWGCYHRGRTYLFASAEHRDEFLANGDQYAPVLSGADPVMAIDTGKIEPGKQEFGIEYAGNFYLFSTEENLRKFWSEADRYAAGVRQAMQTTPEAPKYR